MSTNPKLRPLLVALVAGASLLAAAPARATEGSQMYTGMKAVSVRGLDGTPVIIKPGASVTPAQMRTFGHSLPAGQMRPTRDLVRSTNLHGGVAPSFTSTSRR